MKKLTFLTLVAALSACAPADVTGAAGQPVIPEKQTVSIEAITTSTKGFTVGSAVSARTTYVFFDAQCPHCATLWNAAKPLHAQMKFVWIPVGILNKASTAQGIALLAASDPAAKMDEHELSLLAHKGGISASANADPALASAVITNTRVLRSFGAESIPFVVALNADGTVVSAPGAGTTQALAQMIGVTYTPSDAGATPR